VDGRDKPDHDGNRVVAGLRLILISRCMNSCEEIYPRSGILPYPPRIPAHGGRRPEAVHRWSGERRFTTVSQAGVGKPGRGPPSLQTAA